MDNISLDYLKNIKEIYLTNEELNTIQIEVNKITKKYISSDLVEEFENNDFKEKNFTVDNEKKYLIDCVISKKETKILFPIKDIENVFGRIFADDIKNKKSLLFWKLFHVYYIWSELNAQVFDYSSDEIVTTKINDLKTKADKIIHSNYILLEENNLKENKKEYKKVDIHINLYVLKDFVKLLNKIN